MVCAQVLDNVWVLYGTQKMTLLLKVSHDTCISWGSELKEGRVEDFGSTGEVTTHGLADSTIRPKSKRLSFEELNSLVVKLILWVGLLSHHDELQTKRFLLMNKKPNRLEQSPLPDPVAVSERPGYPGRRHVRRVARAARAVGLWVEKNPIPTLLL